MARSVISHQAQFLDSIATLASAGQRPAAATQAIEVDGGHGRRACRGDLFDGDPFTVAHDLAATLVGALVALAEGSHVDIDDRLFRSGPEAAADETRECLLCEGHRRRESRRANSTQAHVAQVAMRADLIVGVLGRRTQPGVHRRHFFVEQCGQYPAALLEQPVDAGARRGGGGAIVEVLGGRAEHHVAEHGGCHQHALGDRRRYGEHGAVEQRTGELVEHDELAASRPDRESVETEGPVQFVAVLQRCGGGKYWIERSGFDEIAGWTTAES